MSDEVLLTQSQPGIALITLNRPAVCNAIDFAMLTALEGCLKSLRSDAATRVVIITGSGERAFCAGADLEERIRLDDEQVKNFLSKIGGIFNGIESLSQPVIAAVNGVALGGGTELALACDIRLASTNASLGLTETRLGVIPGAGGTQRLPRLIGPGRAKEMVFTGRRVDAQEALQIGLVNRLHDQGALLNACRRMAETICHGGPVAIAQAKHAINRGLDTSLPGGLAIESQAYGVTLPTEDRLEGLAAFREKREPRYKGR